jgi:hypothetical protein
MTTFTRSINTKLQKARIAYISMKHDHEPNVKQFAINLAAHIQLILLLQTPDPLHKTEAKEVYQGMLAYASKNLDHLQVKFNVVNLHVRNVIDQYDIDWERCFKFVKKSEEEEEAETLLKQLYIL